MKAIRTTAALALALFVQAGPALADGHHDHDRDRHYDDRHREAPPRVAHRFREGQVWHGHRVTNRGGNWGYYQPRNGTQIFIRIPV